MAAKKEEEEGGGGDKIGRKNIFPEKRKRKKVKVRFSRGRMSSKNACPDLFS
jgi:hypothetical protein